MDNKLSSIQEVLWSGKIFVVECNYTFLNSHGQNGWKIGLIAWPVMKELRHIATQSPDLMDQHKIYTKHEFIISKREVYYIN